MTILEYLEKRSDYAIWAGFCVFAHLGIRHSPDVDIYTSSLEVKNEISSEFQKRGWRSMPHSEIGFGWNWDKLEKNKTTFDIIFTLASSGLLVPDAVEIKTYRYKLRFLSKEGLLLTKLGALSWAKRSADKRERDIESVRRLRDLVETEKLRKLTRQLPESYWLAGQI